MEQRAPRDVRMRLVEVVGRDVIAADAVTLYLAAPGTRQAPASYVPGQHTTLALPVGGNILYRTYSLCSDGQTSRPWEIAVKRQHGGAVSTFLCEQAQIGTIVRASKPEGAFTLSRPLRPDMPLVFVAAGPPRRTRARRWSRPARRGARRARRRPAGGTTAAAVATHVLAACARS